MKEITDKQLNCVRVLCSKLGKTAPEDVLDMTREDASQLIEQLSKEVDSAGSFQNASQLRMTPGNGNGALTRDMQVRLGLAAKLVHQQWAVVRRKPTTSEAKDTFRREVIDLYALLGEVEQQLVKVTQGGACA